jgi:predicted glycosyltransferase
VLISSEGPLPGELEPFRFVAPAHQMHHFLAHARMLIGESATMASEAAVLGVPAFYIADTGRGYTDDLECKYGLVFNFKLNEVEDAIFKLQTLLEQYDLRSQMAHARARMLEERIDTTQWLLSYVDQVAQTS